MGFNRDELQTLDDARHSGLGVRGVSADYAVDWPGGVMLFGTSLVGFRFFCGGGGQFRDGGGWLDRQGVGRRTAGPVAGGGCGGIAPVSLVQGAVMQYVSFDYCGACW